MLTPGKIWPGTTVTLTAQFTDSAGVLSNPATVLFKTLDPDGTILTYTYGTDANVTRPSTGNYQATMVPDQGGRWRIRWETTGGVLVTEDDFIVKDSQFTNNPTWLGYV